MKKNGFHEVIRTRELTMVHDVVPRRIHKMETTMIEKHTKLLSCTIIERPIQLDRKSQLSGYVITLTEFNCFAPLLDTKERLVIWFVLSEVELKYIPPNSESWTLNRKYLGIQTWSYKNKLIVFIIHSHFFLFLVSSSTILIIGLLFRLYQCSLCCG